MCTAYPWSGYSTKPICLPATLRISFFCILLSWLTSTIGNAEDCDRQIQGIGGELGYQWRSSPERCEGLFRSPIGAGSIQLVSFYAGRIDYVLSDRTFLSLKVLADRSHNSDSVHIRGVSIPRGVFYRLDATIANGDSLIWPLSDVIDPAEIYSTQVGFWAWRATDGDTVLLPVTVSEAGRPRDSAEDHMLHLIIRLEQSFELVAWKLNDPSTKWDTLQPQSGIAFKPGYPVDVIVPSSPRSVDTILVAVKPLNRSWIITEYILGMPR